jgi:hypothetical protein
MTGGVLESKLAEWKTGEFDGLVIASARSSGIVRHSANPEACWNGELPV